MDADALKMATLFADLSAEDRQLASEHADEATANAGEVLIEQGRWGFDFFVILEGTADVFEGDTRVASVGPGDVLGEIGVMEGTLRTATVVATTPMKLIVMDGRALRALSDTHPDIYAELARLITERRGS